MGKQRLMAKGQEKDLLNSIEESELVYVEEKERGRGGTDVEDFTKRGHEPLFNYFRAFPSTFKFSPLPKPFPLNLTTVSPSHATSRYRG